MDTFRMLEKAFTRLKKAIIVLYPDERGAPPIYDRSGREVAAHPGSRARTTIES